jgi:hypothetical protein
MTESNVSAERDRLIHILVVHYDMFRDKAEEAADLFLHDKALALRTPSDGVKPLKWGETSYGKPEAITVAGTYRITDAWDGGFNVNRGNVSFQSEDGRKNFPTIEAAKAAAQADFEQRILSALSQEAPK